MVIFMFFLQKGCDLIGFKAVFGSVVSEVQYLACD